VFQAEQTSRMSDKPAIRPDGAVGDALRAVARDILAEALAALDDPEKSDAVAVHDYRKAMKRWRALLRLIIPFIGEEGEQLRVEARDLARELAGHYRRARQAAPADWHAASSEELHRLRQRVVVHRYQMELVEPLWPRLTKLWVAEAQRLRERLGAHHDLTTLATLIAPHQPLARWRSRLAPLIAAREAAHVKAAAKVAGRLFAEKPRAFRRRLEALWDSDDGGQTTDDG